MTAYAEFAPGEGLASRLACVWTSEAGASALVKRVVPDGCIDLIWTSTTGSVQVAGPDTQAVIAPIAAAQRFVAVRFRPGAAADVLGVPAHVLRDLRVPLAQLWGGEAERLADALNDGGGVRTMEALVGERIRTAGPPQPVVGAVVARVRAGLSVRALAHDLGVSERHLRRQSLDAFGYGPKVLQRVLRFQRAVRLAPGVATWADLAHQTGRRPGPSGSGSATALRPHAHRARGRPHVRGPVDGPGLTD
ncbi:MAG TPA: DUF6597 domain-containing transcriptional factor [Jiangellaceae bacterium]